MRTHKTNPNDRTLGIYTKLINGCIVRKSEEALRYGVNPRTIQRDIDDIRNYLKNSSNNDGYFNTVIYDNKAKGFRFEQIYKLKLTDSEVLAVCKILLDSRALTKQEMSVVLDKLIMCCVPTKSQKQITELIRNEEFHYVEPRHHKVFINTMWEIGQAIRERNYIEVDYKRIRDKTVVTRKLKPVAIMFSEYYFYMAAFIEDSTVQDDFDVRGDSFPTIYRLDRIERLKILNETFSIPYTDRFEEGEFRKRIQFMYGGELQTVTFKYTGSDVNAILDRLPTAKILSEEDGVYTIKAETFGKGIDMWLRSQGENITVIKKEG